MRYLGVTKTYTDSYKKREFEMQTADKLVLAENVSGHVSDCEQPKHFGKSSCRGETTCPMRSDSLHEMDTCG